MRPPVGFLLFRVCVRSHVWVKSLRVDSYGVTLAVVFSSLCLLYGGMWTPILFYMTLLSAVYVECVDVKETLYLVSSAWVYHVPLAVVLTVICSFF